MYEDSGLQRVVYFLKFQLLSYQSTAVLHASALSPLDSIYKQFKCDVEVVVGKSTCSDLITIKGIGGDIFVLLLL